MPNYGTYALCPFFESERDKKVICKGMSCLCQEVLTTLEFQTKENKKAWLRKNCETFAYEKCPYYHVIGMKMVCDSRSLECLRIKKKENQEQVKGQIEFDWSDTNEQKSK